MLGSVWTRCVCCKRGVGSGHTVCLSQTTPNLVVTGQLSRRLRRTKGALNLPLRKSGIASEWEKNRGFVKFQPIWIDLGHSVLQDGVAITTELQRMDGLVNRTLPKAQLPLWRGGFAWPEVSCSLLCPMPNRGTDNNYLVRMFTTGHSCDICGLPTGFQRPDGPTKPLYWWTMSTVYMMGKHWACRQCNLVNITLCSHPQHVSHLHLPTDANFPCENEQTEDHCDMLAVSYESVTSGFDFNGHFCNVNLLEKKTRSTRDVYTWALTCQRTSPALRFSWPNLQTYDWLSQITPLLSLLISDAHRPLTPLERLGLAETTHATLISVLSLWVS